MSQIRCVCFRDQARALKFRPEDGLHVTVRGSLGVYEARGEYQLYVSYIEPVGLGALQLAFEQLKKSCSSKASSTKPPRSRCPYFRDVSEWSRLRPARPFATS